MAGQLKVGPMSVEKQMVSEIRSRGAPPPQPLRHYRVDACRLRFQCKLHAADNVHHPNAMRFQVLRPGFGVARTGEHNRYAHDKYWLLPF